jgi:hypothetical protein
MIFITLDIQMDFFLHIHFDIKRLLQRDLMDTFWRPWSAWMQGRLVIRALEKLVSRPLVGQIVYDWRWCSMSRKTSLSPRIHSADFFTFRKVMDATSDTIACIEWCIHVNLLQHEMFCNKCDTPMALYSVNNYWRCMKRGRKKERVGTK